MRQSNSLCLQQNPAWSSRNVDSDHEHYRHFHTRHHATKTLSSGDPFRRHLKQARLEAVLFVAEGALSPRRIAQFATLIDHNEATKLIDELNAMYDAQGSSFRIERVAAGYQMMTRPEFAPWLNKLHFRQMEIKLSAPAMETLTIVAYRQPMTRAEVEAIRGVQSTEMLKHLLERSLLRIAGQEETLGRPYLYETTKMFLELFGLRNLKDLPFADELREIKKRKVSAVSEEMTTANVQQDQPDESQAA